MLVFFDRIPVRVFRSLPPIGTVLATIVVWSAGASLMVPYAGFYFWVVLSSFYLFDARWAWWNVAFVGIAFSVALAVTPDQHNPAVSWVMVMGALAVGGAMIGLLRSRLERLLGELQESLSRTKDSERALAEAQRIAGVGSWELDPSASSFVASDEMFRMIGASRGSSPRLDALLAGVYPDDRPRVVRAFRDALSARGSVDIEYRITLEDGSLHWVHSRGRPADGHGPTRLVGTTQDVTARKTHEEELTRT